MVKNIKTNNALGSVFEIDETYESENWIKVKIRAFGFNKNRNGSDILETSLTELSRARESIGAIPIVARYNSDEDNLEGHNVKLRKNKDDEYEFFHDTDALGFTSPTANFYFENVLEDAGDSSPRTYVVIEDVYLWKRFDATKKIIEWMEEGIAPRVSIEIDEVEGKFDEEGYFQIEDFIFSAVAVLGSDVEPCFKKAEIQLYTANDFRSDLKTLMQELGDYSLQEGGSEMPAQEKEKNAIEYEDETAKDAAVDSDASSNEGDTDTAIKKEGSESTAKDSKENFEDDSEGDDNGDTETEEPDVTDPDEGDTDEGEPEIEPEEPEVDPDPEPEPEPEIPLTPLEPSEKVSQDSDDDSSVDKAKIKKRPEKFALTANQLRDELRIKLGKEVYVDTWGDERRKYWYVDHTDDSVVYEDTQDDYQLHKAPYTLTGDEAEVHFVDAFKVKVDYVPFEGESSSFTNNTERFSKLHAQTVEAKQEAETELQENYASLSADYEKAKNQLKELQAYKRSNEEAEVKAKFEGKLSEDELTQVFSDMKEESLENVEEKLFALVGKKNFAVQQVVENKTSNIKINNKDDSPPNPFKALEQFVK